jgi:SAM-dependent methyltransferase
LKRSLGRRVKDFFVRAVWGNRTYHALLRPLDRYEVEVKPSASFGLDPPLNKLCRVADSRNPLWNKGASDLLFPPERELFHRKVWEFCQVLYGLRKLRRLCPKAVALGIGCGHEELMYFLANRVKEVCATDLYEKRYLGGESSEDVLIHPEKYAPFHYREDHLRVMKMDAGELKFEDGTFDFAFCLSSLEHFGGKRRQLQALGEMFRVLKPGGVAALTTELILNRLGRARKGYFSFDELSGLVRESGFVLTEPVDLAIEEEYARPPLALPMEFQRTPHVILRNFNIIYTSISLFLSKPESAEQSKNAVTGPEEEAPTRPFRWSARIEIIDGRERVKAEESFRLRLRLENTGDAPWFRNSSQSHMVRIGAGWLDSDGNDLGLDIPHFELPGDVRPGEWVEVALLIPPIRKKGSFYLQIDLVRELCFWFREKGSTPKRLPLTSS